MGLRLLLYLIILITGGIVGYKDLVEDKIYSKINHIQNICLLTLLFIMGIRMGLDPKVVNSFFALGLKAFMLSSLSIVFSIIMVKLITSFTFKAKDKEDCKNEY